MPIFLLLLLLTAVPPVPMPPFLLFPPLQTSKDFALVLRSMGLTVNSMGGETEMDLKGYSFSGHAKRGIR